MQCGTPMATRRAGSVFCEAKCRAKFNRHGGVPKELRRIPRWVGWKPVERRGKIAKLPLNVHGGPARVDDPTTWSTFQEARAKFGDRIGFVLDDSDDISCVDLDDVLIDGEPLEGAGAVLSAIPGIFYVEVSQSGAGLHAWHHGPQADGTRRVEHGVSVERYSKSRFIAVTGKTFWG